VIKGTSIEYLLRQLFEQYLPLRFSVGTGQVATAKGEVSPQMDLMIYDRTTFPHLSSNEDGSIVVCCESVYGCIEVKTRWDHADVQKHFSGFSKVDAQRDPHFNISSSEDAASYTVVLIEKLDRFDWEWSDLKDQSRQVLVTSLEGDKVWHSEWGEGGFRETQTSNPLEDVFRELLRDCLRKKFIETNNLHKTYEALSKYFGWSPSVQ
jgi:hypothetical protein